MKKTILFLSLVILSFLIIIILPFSCNKKENVIQKPINEIKNFNYVAYPSNPYDSVGLIHNLCLEQERILKTLHPDITIHQLYDSLDLYIAENFSHNYTPVSYSQFTDSFNVQLNDNSGTPYSDPYQVVLAWYDRGLLTENEKDYIETGLDIVQLDSTIEYTNSMVNDLEDQVIADNLLSAAEKKLILCYLATLRYSYEYWYTNQEDEWAKNSPNTIFQFTGKCKAGCKWCVAGMDALGILCVGSLTGYNGNAMLVGGAIISIWSRCCGFCGRCDNWNCDVNYAKKNKKVISIKI